MQSSSSHDPREAAVSPLDTPISPSGAQPDPPFSLRHVTPMGANHFVPPKGERAQPKAGDLEALARREEFRLRMRRELGEPRARKRFPDPDVSPSGRPEPEQSARRLQVRERIRQAQANRPLPTVAVSYRGGFGYDEGTFSKGPRRRATATVQSSPPGFKALPQVVDRKNPTAEEQAVALAREQEVIAARTTTFPLLSGQKVTVDPVADEPAEAAESRRTKKSAAVSHLQSAHGLLIPGAQDVAGETVHEIPSRRDYEPELVRRARDLGLPTLAYCGGSRALARGFGGVEKDLRGQAKTLHNKGGTDKMPHGLGLTAHTILGGNAGGTIDAINSTHAKIVDLAGVPPLPSGEPELTVSATARAIEGTKATDPHPEGFETTHGAPMVGVTSHPEAIHGASGTARTAATDTGKAWSDDLVHGFAQSMHTYAARQDVNAQIHDQMKRLDPLVRRRVTAGKTVLPPSAETFRGAPSNRGRGPRRRGGKF